jgi:serine phosphatase RsbU (regulator of sigma subunit)
VPSIPGVELGRCYRPAAGRHAGGDWYTIVPFGDGRIGLGIGDAEGHGLEAIGSMARSRFSMLAYALDQESPAEVLRRANRSVIVTAPPPGIFATATYGVIDVARRTWTEACAGHPPTIVRRANGEAKPLELHPGPPLGVDGSTEYDETFVELDDFDIVALYTDGVIEHRHESLTQGIAALCKQLTEDAEDLTQRCERIIDEIGNPEDDAAMLIARLSVIRAT